MIMTGCSNSKEANPEGIKEVSIINGYTVPPVPDKVLNNSSLLGVDSDKNGIRDDVDRFIAEEYPEPLEHAMAEMNAKTFVNVFKDPENAYERKLDLSTSEYINCKLYIKHKLKKDVGNMNNIDSVVINTPERSKAYFIYNQSFSGHSFKMEMSMTEKDCPKEVLDVANEK